MGGPQLEFHREATAVLNAPIDVAFAHLDDFHQLSVHMERSSAMMMGSRMHMEADEMEGRAVGSTVSMDGRVLGVGRWLGRLLKWCVETMAADAVSRFGAPAAAAA